MTLHNKEECNGCYRKETELCLFLYAFDHKYLDKKLVIDVDDCPCNTCIIKGVCNRPCGDRYEFWKKEHYRLHSEMMVIS